VDRGSRKSLLQRHASIVAALLVIPMARYIPAVPVRADIHNWFCWRWYWCWRVCWQGRGPGHRFDSESKQIGLVFSIIVVPITF